MMLSMVSGNNTTLQLTVSSELYSLVGIAYRKEHKTLYRVSSGYVLNVLDRIVVLSGEFFFSSFYCKPTMDQITEPGLLYKSV